ncbi:hypothetical protein D352_01274 [Enterococcus faecium LA4B-2]|nr:hypothetical protein D352_01274 [Enterococcus faecium LA4B-2]
MLFYCTLFLAFFANILLKTLYFKFFSQSSLTFFAKLKKFG